MASFHFTWLDWVVVMLYLLGTTWVGHYFSGKQATIRDFFLGGRTLPWAAVSGSIIATSISAITFVGVPAMVYAANGNFTYLQLAFGSILARVIIAKWFVKAFYEKEIYSPYDYMQEKLGPVVGKLSCLLFFLGSTLGQGVRVYATALVLQVVVPQLDMWQSIMIIGFFAILWTWLGGMSTVIWTDVAQFFIFIIGGVSALIFILFHVPLSMPETFAQAFEAGKFKLFDFSTSPGVSFTFWAALIAMPFQNLAAYGTDQLNAQRMFCCRSEKDASKAILASCFSEVITVIMLTVGALLYVYYQHFHLNPSLAASVAEKSDRIFPIFIVTQLPPGLTGLLIAGIFAAAISSLDSILAALAQTSMTMFYQPHIAPYKSEKHYLSVSRVLVIGWGIILCFMAWLLSRGVQDLVNLAFTMTTYTYGPMLGIFFLAFFPLHRNARGLIIGVPLSVFTVYLLNHPDLMHMILPFTQNWPQLAWPWLFPIGTFITLGFGYFLGKKKA